MPTRKAIVAALFVGLSTGASAYDGRIYPNGDHYIQLPDSWYSYNHFRVGAAYAYARQTSDIEADGIAATLEFTTPVTSRVFMSGGAFATVLKDVQRETFDHYNAYLAFGVHEPFTPSFDAALELGPAITHEAEDGAFGPDEETNVEIFARTVAYIKLKNALDLRIAAGVMGEPFADLSLDIRISRGFSIEPSILYRSIGSQDLWATGFTLGFHFGSGT